MVLLPLIQVPPETKVGPHSRHYLLCLVSFMLVCSIILVIEELSIRLWPDSEICEVFMLVCCSM